VRIANRLGVPVTAGYHVQPENILYNIGIRSAWLADHLHRFFVNRLYNRCAAVVCPSPFAESELRRCGLRAPSVVISNGLTAQFRPQALARDPAWRDDFVVLMVSRLAREKRHDVVIKAVSLSRHAAQIRLVIIGKGPLKAAIAQMGSGLPQPPEMRTVPDEELIQLYRTADLLVHASEVELEGMSVLEALGCGLPVLVSDARTSAAKQFALDGRSLFRSGDPRSLAERLDYWIEHPEELKAARQLYIDLSQQFRIEESVRKLEDLYRQCVAAGRAGTPGVAPVQVHRA
jgi:1,2-diacylglycerol 3-alpha-glucosyltransferase